MKTQLRKLRRARTCFSSPSRLSSGPHIVRAQGTDNISQGLGTDYVWYDWSACAMLMIMHCFGGAPFKRIKFLHEGWGVPMPDANQQEVVSAGDDLLQRLYEALEQYAIQKATSVRVDDTGAMVIALSKHGTGCHSSSDIRALARCLLRHLAIRRAVAQNPSVLAGSACDRTANAHPRLHVRRARRP